MPSELPDLCPHIVDIARRLMAEQGLKIISRGDRVLTHCNTGGLATVDNPAFDVTPAALVDGWILEQGLFDREQVRSGALRKILGKEL
ncbi:MAG: hypothetical protein KF802_05170 [Bdellovibrionaceae bacterium]|nr:hypothetical protein [Pseudobdellovibrionaceae bacterium]MBX3032299.1 hypothetical protein [Pseudobdellovibrionaceae bacterium]